MREKSTAKKALLQHRFQRILFSFFSRVVEFVCRSIAAYIFQMQKENKREHLVETACCRKTEYVFFFWSQSILANRTPIDFFEWIGY